MASPGDPGARAMAKAKQLKVVLPPAMAKLRISEELSGCFGAGDGARVVSPFGKVWRVDIERDGEGAFLGRGWPEFLSAHGVGVGWFVVLRHEGGGALTVKVFDTSFCIKEFGAPAAVPASTSSKGVSCKPQFIRIIHQNSMEKMMIPAKFVKQYVPKECLNIQMAVISSPLGKFWRVDVENDQSGVFFAGGWSQFLKSHCITEGDIVLLRYEGGMAFKFKAFGLDGCQKDFINQDTGTQQSTEKRQGAPLSPSRKRKMINENPGYHENDSPDCQENKSPGCQENENNTSLQKRFDYQIGTQSWIKKKITTPQLKHLSLSPEFCNRMGFVKTCTVILKTEMDGTRSWQTRALAYYKARYLQGEGWKSFCKENNLKSGDVCTFNIIETTLWQVTITRLPTYTDKQKQQESPSSSGWECKSKNDWSGSEGSKSKNDWSSSEGSKSKTGGSSCEEPKRFTKCDYNLGPPSWIRKELTPNSLKKPLNVPHNFCHAIGLRGPRTIILKTSISSSESWQVHGFMQKNRSYLLGQGWKRFCEENKLKEGDICTFKLFRPRCGTLLSCIHKLDQIIHQACVTF